MILCPPSQVMPKDVAESSCVSFVQSEIIEDFVNRICPFHAQQEPGASPLLQKGDRLYVFLDYSRANPELPSIDFIYQLNKRLQDFASTGTPRTRHAVRFARRRNGSSVPTDRMIAGYGGQPGSNCSAHRLSACRVRGGSVFRSRPSTPPGSLMVEIVQRFLDQLGELGAPRGVVAGVAEFGDRPVPLPLECQSLA